MKNKALMTLAKVLEQQELCPRKYTEGKWGSSRCADCGLMVLAIRDCWIEYANTPDRDWSKLRK